MRRSGFVRVLALGLAAGLLSGCFRAAELSQMRREIEQELPEARFEKQVELTLGPMSLGVARMLSELNPEGRQERDLLEDIDRIKMAVYRVESMPSLEGFKLPVQMRRLLEGENWEELVKAREKDEFFWMLYRLQEQAVPDMYIIGLDPEELFLVHLEGRLDRVLARAVEMQPGQIAGCFGRRENWGKLADAKPVTGPGRDAKNALMPDFWEVEQGGPWGRYNRVDGLYLGTRRLPARDRGPEWYGEWGYAFSGKYWRYQLGAEVSSRAWQGSSWPADIRWHRVSAGTEFHRLTDTQDNWIISEVENTLTALLFRRDFRDYYRRSGWSAYGSYYLGRAVRLTGRLVQDDFASLTLSEDWGLFDRDWARRAFRANPVVEEIRINSARAEVQVDTRDHRTHPRRGWLAAGLAEKAGGFLKGDGRFQRYMLDLRRYQPVGPGMRLDLRTRLGTATGRLPVQYRYSFGGYSSLRGYGFKEFVGDRMALGNAEFWIDLGKYWDDLPLPDRVTGGAFLDAGAAWNKGDPADGPDLKASHGWAVNSDDIRIYFARPLQVKDARWDVSFRVSRSF
jgi:hypothetical protein